MNVKAIITAGLILLAAGFPPRAAGAASPPGTALLDHARHLAAAGDWYRASGEIKRFLYFHPRHPKAVEARAFLQNMEEQLAARRKDNRKEPFVPWRLSRPETENSDAAHTTGKKRGQAMVGLVRFYQNHLRTFSSSKSVCPSHPNCSEYAIQAIEKHGAVLGAFIYVDRYWREATTAGQPPHVRVRDVIKHFDPLEWNDYWLPGSEDAP